MDGLKHFQEKYEIKVLDTNRRHQRYQPTYYRHDGLHEFRQEYMGSFDTEALYTIAIPESQLTTLVAMEDKLFKFRERRQHGDLAEVLLDKEREEIHLRKTVSAIGKAYDEYILLLRLAGSTEKF